MTIADSGVVGSDVVVLNFLANRYVVGSVRVGNDLYISDNVDVADGHTEYGVIIPNWYVQKTQFKVADGTIVTF